MLGRTYEKEICSAARALEIVGERWSLLILRNAAFAGMTRFNEFQKSLGIAPNVLAARLGHFVEEGLMVVEPGARGQPEYHLTEKGLDFEKVIIALTEWGDRWAAPYGPPVVYEHAACGGRVESALQCASCEAAPRARDVVAQKTPAMAKLGAARRKPEGRRRS